MSIEGEPESILLNYNSLAQAAVAHFGDCIDDDMTKKQVLLQLQGVCATYACQGVKRNAGLTNTKKKQQAATHAYKTIVVPGFFAWLRDLEDSPVQIPQWCSEELMGCSSVSGTGKGEPKYYNDNSKVWTKHMEDYLIIRRDVNPVFDGLTPRQPSGQLPSGQQYIDQLSQLLDELWIIRCKQLGKKVVDVEQEDESRAPRSSQSSPATVKDDDGGPETPSGRGSEEEGADDTQQGAAGQPASGEKLPEEVEEVSESTAEAGGGSSAEAGGGGDSETGSGGAAKKGSGGDSEPEPDQDSPDYPRWVARQAAMNAKKAAAAAAASSSGDSSGDSSKHPPRPTNWMHPLTLTFCFFGRPAGKDEDTELATCVASSGPPSRGKKKKGGKGKGSDSEGGSSGGGSPTENPLHPGAIRQFAGAGEAQSRAKVKKATAEVQQRESREATRMQFLQQNKEQLKVAKEMRDAVVRVAENTSAQRALQEEEACRKRKMQAVNDLEGDLQYCEPHEAAGIKAKIRATRKTPVNQLTAEFVAGGMANAPRPSAPAAAPVVPALPGFSQNNATPGSAGGGATAQSEVAADSVGASAVTRV